MQKQQKTKNYRLVEFCFQSALDRVKPLIDFFTRDGGTT
jgi:hypothetical protein